MDGQAFAGIHLLFGPISLNNGNPGTPGVPPPPSPPVAYTGTVTTAGSFTVGTLEVDCGQIKQADPATVNSIFFPHAGTLTVKTTFDWTGGTLNSNTVAGKISLAPGATGTAEPSFTNPGINGTVYLGSTLELQGIPEDSPTPSLGSTLTMTDGTYNVNGGGFHALDGSQLIMAPVPKATGSPGKGSITVNNEEATTPAVTVDAGATGKVTSAGRTGGNTDVVEVKVSGFGVQVHNQGTVVIDSYTQLIMAKKNGAAFVEYLQNLAGGSPAPVTKLQAGCEIKFEDSGQLTKGCVNLDAGQLQLFGLPGSPAADQVAKITAPTRQPDGPLIAPALFVGRDAKVTFAPLNPFVTLSLNGDFTSEGTLVMRADRTKADNDQITATGTMNLQTGQGATLRVTELVVTWANPGSNLPTVNTEWTLLKGVGANGGIANEPTTTVPSVDLPDTLTPGRLTAPNTYGMKFTKG